MGVRKYKDWYVAIVHSPILPPLIVKGPYQNQQDAIDVAEVLSRTEYKPHVVIERQYEFDDKD